MFTWIVGTSLRNRFLLMAFSGVLIAFGTDQLRKMPVDVFPEFAPPKIEIQTEGLGMTAAEIEELITTPMEFNLRGMPGIDVIRSSSVEGLSQVVVLFKKGVDLMEARQRLQERLQLAIAELPQSSGMPVILQPLSSTSRVMKIGISSKVHDMLDLSMIAYWTIRFRLMSVPGVANIPIWGERIKALHVQPDPDRMRAYNVTLDEILETTSDALDFSLLQYTGHAKTRIDGMFDTPNQRLVIHHESPVFSPEHLARVPVGLTKTRPGGSPALGEVANVKWDTWPLVGDSVINDEVGLMMIVEKLPWANTLDVTRGIEAALEELKPGLKDIEIDSTIFRPATFIEDSIKNLNGALVSGSILVVVILCAFLYEWRVALISIMAIPLSLITAGLILYYRGATINTMVLAGFIVGLGDVVDDAIIDVENIVRRLREHQKAGSNKSIARIILDASLEVRTAIVHSTLIIILAVSPVFFMGGLSGSFFEPLAMSYIIAIAASTVVALTITPAMCYILLGNKPLRERESPLVVWLKRIYTAILARALRASKVTYAIAGITVVAGFGVYPFLGQSLLPEFKERDFLMHWVPAEGTSHPETFRITRQASLELRTIPGVRNFGAHIGRAVGGDEPYGVNFTENWISISPDVDYDKTRGAVEEAVIGYPGMRRDVQTYLKERIREVLTGSGEAVVIRIYGPELPVLREKAAELEEALQGIPGLIDLHRGQLVEIPQIRIRLNLEKAQQYGLKPGDLRPTIAMLMSGIEVTDIHRDGKVYDVFVWVGEERRRDIDQIRAFPVDTPYGGVVRLSDVADVDMVSTPNAIKHENTLRWIGVDGNVKGRDLNSVVEDVKERLKTVKFPVGYYPQLLGEYKERQAAQKNLFNASIIVAIAIFIMLQVTFRNVRLAVLIFIALPMALAGALLATFLGDGVISLGSLVGAITILGLSSRNSIMLIEHYQHLEHEEGEPFGLNLILRGAIERLSPILMTTLATVFALLPLVIRGDLPGYEVEYPMAIAILGGVVTSTLLSLFIVPVLYNRFGGGTQKIGT